MPTKKPKQEKSTSKAPVSAQEPSLQALYDLIMERVEPDLVSWMLPHLETLYEDESPMEKALRMERYERAFERADELFNALVAAYKNELVAARDQAMQGYKEKVEQEEQKNIADIDRAIGET